MKTEFSGSFNCGSCNLEKYRCQNCQYETEMLLLLKHHVTTFHSCKIETKNCLPYREFRMRNYICSGCKFESHFSLQVLKHAINCLQKLKTPLSSGSLLPKNLYTCRHCPYTTTTLCWLKKHLNSWKKDAKRAKAARLLKCKKCSYTAKRRSCLMAHRKFKNHHLDRPNVKPKQAWQCDVCVAEFKEKATLRMHMWRKHSPEEYIKWYNTKYNQKDCRWFACDQCDSVLKSEGGLRSHKRRKHVENEDLCRWYQCQFCAFKSLKKDDVDKHEFRKHKAMEIESCIL